MVLRRPVETARRFRQLQVAVSENRDFTGVSFSKIGPASSAVAFFKREVLLPFSREEVDFAHEHG